MAREETESQRLDRNYRDLLQELRVTQTGVQILFAFLLILPFSARWESVNEFQRIVYVVALLSAAGAAAMIIAPVAYHRMLFRRGRKLELVRSAHLMASGGLALLLVSMVCSVLLITDLVLSRTVATVLTAAAACWFILLWALLPWLRRRRADRESLSD